MYLYGDVLYGTMSCIKGKCSGKRAFHKELVNYMILWSLSLHLLTDEILNGTDNIDTLKKFLQNNSYKNADMGIYTACSEAAPPLEAISLMVKIIAEINILMLDFKGKNPEINRYLFALHNLPRCLLSPERMERISQRDAIEYSMGYLSR